MNRLKFTDDQVEEITRLLLEGFTNRDVVELLADKYGMRPETIINKIGTIKKMFKAQGKKIPRVRALKKVILPPVVKKTLIDSVGSNVTKIIEERKKEEPEEARIRRLAKTKVVSIKKKIPEVTFPLVARYVKMNTGQVVMFTSLHRGVVIHPAESTLYAGYVNENFAACTDKEYWDILDEFTMTFYS